MGTEYWKGLFDWVEKTMLGNAYISAEDLKLYRMVDTAEDAVEHILRFYEKYLLKPNF